MLSFVNHLRQKSPDGDRRRKHLVFVARRNVVLITDRLNLLLCQHVGKGMIIVLLKRRKEQKKPMR